MKYLILFPKEKSQWIYSDNKMVDHLPAFAQCLILHDPHARQFLFRPAEPLSQEEKQIRDNLEKHVKALSDTIGERNIRSNEQLKASRNYISAALEQSGYTLSYQKYVVEGKTVENIEAELLGKSISDEIIVIGAHYDSVPLCPGANDNASGSGSIAGNGPYPGGKEICENTEICCIHE